MAADRVAGSREGRQAAHKLPVYYIAVSVIVRVPVDDNFATHSTNSTHYSPHFPGTTLAATLKPYRWPTWGRAVSAWRAVAGSTASCTSSTRHSRTQVSEGSTRVVGRGPRPSRQG